MIELGRDLLIQAVQTCVKLIPSKPLKEEFGFVRFYTSDGMGFLFSLSEDAVMRYSFPVESDTNVDMAFPGHQLKDILNKSASGARIRFSQQDTIALVESTDGSRYELPTIDTKLIDWVDFEVDRDGEMPFEPGELDDAWRAVAFSTSDNDSRHAISAVCLDIGVAGTNMVTTNGHTLAKYTWDSKIHKTPVTVLLPQTLGPIIQMLGDQASRVRWTKNMVEIEWYDINDQSICKVVSRQVDGRFPAYHNILPALQTGPVDLVACRLMETIQRAALVVDDQRPGVDLAASKGSKQLTAETKTVRGQSHAVYEHEGTFDAAIQVRIDPRYMAAALKQFPGQVEFHFYGKERPLCLHAEIGNNQTKLTCLIMPMSA